MKNKFKIVFAVVVATVLCIAFSSCKAQSDGAVSTLYNAQNGASAASESEMSADYGEDETEPQYYHSGVEGAEVILQDGTSNYSFVYKCEWCGKTQMGTHDHSATGGTYNGSFMCSYCHEMQQFQVRTEKV